MSQLTIEVRPNVLKAVSLFCADKEVRFYLKGIYLETNSKGALFVATNGHALAAYHIDGVFSESKGIIPVGLIENALSVYGKTPVVNLSVNNGLNVSFFSIEKLSDPAIDATFPDFRRIFPDTWSDKPAQFDPEYISRFSKASKLLGSKKGLVTIAHNGLAAALVGIQDQNFIGILMPMRSENMPIIPEWIKTTEVA